MKLQSKYRMQKIPDVIMSDELITEQNGYMSVKDQVERLLLAGQRLDALRYSELDAYYDSEDPDDENQDAFTVYEQDPVELQEAVERRLRFKKGVQTPEESEEPATEAPQSLGEEKLVHSEIEDLSDG